jgi:hydroxymethylglutaryl-CoA lyase
MSHITIVEVGPRDGLQNESQWVPTADKLAFIAALRAAGLKRIEVTSLTHPKAIPQLADATDVLASLPSPGPDDRFSVLIPNAKGLERALETNAKRPDDHVINEVAVITAVSETFNQQNIRQSVEESLEQMGPIAMQAMAAGLTVRGYLSTAFHCPYDGPMSAERVLEITQRMLAMGLREISIGDTIGRAIPDEVEALLILLLARIPANRLAMHFHNTNGLALQNVAVALKLGIRVFDASAGGMGGCPYAPGASGNLSTDELVAFLHANHYTSGVDPQKLALASRQLRQALNTGEG